MSSHSIEGEYPTLSGKEPALKKQTTPPGWEGDEKQVRISTETEKAAQALWPTASTGFLVRWLLPFVGADELAFVEDVSLHGLEKLVFGQAGGFL